MIAEALATPGLPWVAGAAVLAGLTRGFSGFGSALVFMPLAGMVLPPVWAVVVLLVMDLFGPLPGLPRTLREAGRRDVAVMALGLLIGLPAGIWMLLALPETAFRWAVSGVALVTLALMLTGWRYRGPRGVKVRLGVGAVAGVLAGATALAGPPAILFEMSSDQPVARIRANLMLFLLGADLVMLALLLGSGTAPVQVMVLGGLLILPFTLATMAGTALFNPDHATLYRRASYGLIAASALLGLPWGA